IGSMLRVMEYYQIDKAGERKILEEVSVLLAGLSRTQMSEVIGLLEAAAKQTDPAKSEAELEKAYTRHREILDTLQTILAKYDAVKSLDQAADRFEKYAYDQFDLHLASFNLIKEIDDRTDPGVQAWEKIFWGRRAARNAALEPKRQSDQQGELEIKVAALIKQVSD